MRAQFEKKDCRSKHCRKASDFNRLKRRHCQCGIAQPIPPIQTAAQPPCIAEAKQGPMVGFREKCCQKFKRKKDLPHSPEATMRSEVELEKKPAA